MLVNDRKYRSKATASKEEECSLTVLGLAEDVLSRGGCEARVCSTLPWLFLTAVHSREIEQAQRFSEPSLSP